MAENLISLEPDKFYHIYNHAIGKENFFETDAVYLWFLNKLKKYVVPLCKIYSFCLMSYHFHFVLRIKSKIEIKNTLNKLNTGRVSVEERIASCKSLSLRYADHLDGGWATRQVKDQQDRRRN